MISAKRQLEDTHTEVWQEALLEIVSRTVSSGVVFIGILRRRKEQALFDWYHVYKFCTRKSKFCACSIGTLLQCYNEKQ